MKRIDIPLKTLQDVQQRIRDGEPWAQVCNDTGYGETALRANFERHGMEYKFGRKARRGKQGAPTHKAHNGWDTNLSNRMLRVAL